MKTATKKGFVVVLAAALLVVSYPGMAFAETAPAVKKVLENTKAYLDDLVTAKDDNTSNDLSLKIETFKQVLDLSSAETKDLEFKLLTTEKDERFETWKKTALDGLAHVLAYYDSERDLLSDPNSVTAEDITTIAKHFKEWRESEYFPLVSKVQDFVLIKQEEKAIQTAEKRLEKVNENLASLGISSNNKSISKYLSKAKSLIDSASELNGEAADLFISRYIATSTEEMAFSTSTPTSTSTSSSSDVNANATSTPPLTSVKDLVRLSLDAVKGAYQSFIDVSGLVRKLLMR